MTAVRVGIVGAGGIFAQHARAIGELAGRARIVGLCELEPGRRTKAATAYSIPFTCRDHRELVDRRDVDLIAVCTPPSLHPPVVIDALAAGKHVVCEKPLAHTLADADAIIEAARAAPGRLSVVYQFRYLPVVRRALWLRDTGALGSLLSGRFHRFARFSRPGKPQRAGWWGRWDMAGGGAVMTQLIHELDLMALFFGRPVQVWGTVDTLKEAIESEDVCAGIVRFESGAVCSCQSTMSAHRSTAGFDLFGTAGSAHAPWAFECLDRERRSELRRAALEAVPDYVPGDVPGYVPEREPCAHTPYLSAVLDAFEAGRPLPIGPEEARVSVELATAIYASALSGEPVSLPLSGTHPQYRGVDSRLYAARGGRRSELTLAG